MATSGLGTTYGENAALDAILGASAPATVYVCFYSAAPTKAGGGTEITNLARKAVTNNSTNFPGASGGVKTTGGSDIVTAAASGACAQATHAGIHAHITNDNLIAWGPVTTPFTAGVGDTAKIAIGGLTITLNNQA
jgi:hypothetical protein